MRLRETVARSLNNCVQCVFVSAVYVHPPPHPSHTHTYTHADIPDSLSNLVNGFLAAGAGDKLEKASRC